MLRNSYNVSINTLLLYSYLVQVYHHGTVHVVSDMKCTRCFLKNLEKRVYGHIKILSLTTHHRFSPILATSSTRIIQYIHSFIKACCIAYMHPKCGKSISLEH